MHFQTSDQEKPEPGFGGYTCNWASQAIPGGVITRNPFFIDSEKYPAHYYPEFAYKQL
jgi:hypothetical protein